MKSKYVVESNGSFALVCNILTDDSQTFDILCFDAPNSATINLNVQRERDAYNLYKFITENANGVAVNIG